jgi:hypothetical protein
VGAIISLHSFLRQLVRQLVAWDVGVPRHAKAAGVCVCVCVGAYIDFKECNDQEEFDRSLYRLQAGHYDDEDLNARLESLAEMYGRKGKSPWLPFTPLTPDGNRVYPECSGIMDQEAFIKAIEDHTALFNEIKLRSLILMARAQQVKDLHRTAKILDGQRLPFIIGATPWVWP